MDENFNNFNKKKHFVRLILLLPLLFRKDSTVLPRIQTITKKSFLRLIECNKGTIELAKMTKILFNQLVTLLDGLEILETVR